MSMRVARVLNNPQSLLDLQRVKQGYSSTVQQLSSGKAIVNIGDDPTGTSQIMNYGSSIDLNSQYMDQVDTANSQLKSVSTVLTTIGTDISRLLTLGQEGLANTTPAGSQAAIASEVDALRTNLISMGNTQVQGKYIFAGTNTTTKPFVDNPSTTPQSVTYQGNSGIINLDVGVSASVATNIPGDSLFFGPSGQGSSTDLLAATTGMRDALNSGDQTALATAYDHLQTISDRINVSVAELGGRENGITALKTGLSDFNSNLTSLQSSIASADYPTAITQLNEQGVAQQATLGTIAKSNQRNLFDYLA